ncbi:MAG: hypothetical protein IKE32_04105 [Aeriscardovia sp.]|nr:hypothetical protein [Aeriscardovia sp.]
MAAERVDPRLMDLLDSFQPAILQMIGHACFGGARVASPYGRARRTGPRPPRPRSVLLMFV